MIVRRGVLVSLVLCAATALAAPPKADKVRLNKKEVHRINQATLAYYQGSPVAVLEALAPLAVQLEAEAREHVNEILGERKLPSLGSLLGQARLAALRQGGQTKSPRVTPAEAVLVLPQLQAHLDQVLAAVAADPVMAEPLPTPESMRQYEDLLWRAHVLTNRLANASIVAEFMGSMAKRVPRRVAARLDADQQKFVHADYGAVVKQIALLSRELEEREVELRIDRLGQSAKVLAAEDLSQDKLLAAYFWTPDLALVNEFFRNNKLKVKTATFRRERLNDKSYVGTAEKNANTAQQLAGGLTLKSQLFFQGLHWWLRGRYGQGTDVFGLAKSPAAMHSAAAQFALYVPAVPPKPTDPAAKNLTVQPVPRYDRRHHYWWAWENRSVARGGFSAYATETVGNSKTRELTTTKFW